MLRRECVVENAATSVCKAGTGDQSSPARFDLARVKSLYDDCLRFPRQNACTVGQSQLLRTVLRRRWWIEMAVAISGGLALPGGAGPVSPETRGATLTNVAQVRAAALATQAVGCAVRVEGIVLWTNSSGDRFLFQDNTGALPVEIDFRNEPRLQPGRQLRLSGKCLVSSGTLTEVVVDNDRLHAALEKSGAIYLYGRAASNPGRLV